MGVNNKVAIASAKLSNYYNKQEVDEIIANLDIPESDLSEYATKEYVNNIVIGGDIDLSDYATKTYVDAINESKANISHIHEQYSLTTHIHNEYVTQEELAAKNYLTEHQDISHLANKSDIPSVKGFATEAWVEKQLENVNVDFTGYATEPWVLEQIDAIPKVDLSEYATKIYVDNLAAGGQIDLSTYATKTYVDAICESKADKSHSHNQYALSTHTHDDILMQYAGLSQSVDNIRKTVYDEQLRAEGAEQAITDMLMQETIGRQEADTELLEEINNKINSIDVYTKEEVDYITGGKRVVYLTCDDFNVLPDEDRVLEDVVYILTDMEDVFASKEYVDNKDDILQANIDAIIVDINNKANAADVYTKEEIDIRTQATDNVLIELEAALDSIIEEAEPAPSEPVEPDPDKPNEGGDN